MRPRDKKLPVFGVLAAVIIAIAAPFLASGNPDGLESAASEFESAEGKEKETHDSPLPDYSIPGIDDEGLSGVIAIVLGTVVTLMIVMALLYGLMKIKRTKKENKE